MPIFTIDFDKCKCDDKHRQIDPANLLAVNRVAGSAFFYHCANCNKLNLFGFHYKKGYSVDIIER